MNRHKRRQWTDDDISLELRNAAAQVGGRMPSANELRMLGLNALACRVARTEGGFRTWALRLGLRLKASETADGQNWEEYVCGVLIAANRAIKRQTARAPFDLLVDGHCRVNVKSARWHEYGSCRGFFFGIAETWRHCDVFAMVAVDGSPTPRILWVPASEAQQQTVTLTARHRFNTYIAMTPLDATYGGGLRTTSDADMTPTERARVLATIRPSGVR